MKKKGLWSGYEDDFLSCLESLLEIRPASAKPGNNWQSQIATSKYLTEVKADLGEENG